MNEAEMELARIRAKAERLERRISDSDGGAR